MNDELIYCEYCDSEKPTNAFRPSDLKRATQKCSDCANRQKREYRSDPTYKRNELDAQNARRKISRDPILNQQKIDNDKQVLQVQSKQKQDGLQFCKHCNITKTIDDFSPSNMRRKQPKCKECVKVDNAYHHSERKVLKEIDDERYPKFLPSIVGSTLAFQGMNKILIDAINALTDRHTNTLIKSNLHQPEKLSISLTLSIETPTGPIHFTVDDHTIINTQCCKSCNKVKHIDDFYPVYGPNERLRFGGRCKECTKVYDIEHDEPAKRQQYYEVHRDEILVNKRKYYDENRDEILESEAKKRQTSEYKNARRAAQNESRKDPIVRLRHNISVSIRQAMKNPKMKISISEHLDWLPEELVKHMEAGWSLPENLTPEGDVWMGWKNYGRYVRKTWVDNDYKTHTWNIDHLIPQDDLPFDTMEDENFKICWALNNLRPYSAKQNNLDGVKRTRHKKKDTK